MILFTILNIKCIVEYEYNCFVVRGKCLKKCTDRPATGSEERRSKLDLKKHNRSPFQVEFRYVVAAGCKNYRISKGFYRSTRFFPFFYIYK